MAKNEKTSEAVGTIAAKGLRDPGSLTRAEIKKLAGSVLTQRPDQSQPAAPKKKPARKPAGK